MRLIALFLLLANAGYLVWSQGLLQAYGLAPQPQSEPQRVQQQIRPEALRLLSNEEARRLESAAAIPAPQPPECLQSSLLNDAEAKVLRQELAAWPAGSWKLETDTEPAVWIVYMGKYPVAEQMAKKNPARLLDLPPTAN